MGWHNFNSFLIEEKSIFCSPGVPFCQIAARLGEYLQNSGNCTLERDNIFKPLRIGMPIAIPVCRNKWHKLLLIIVLCLLCPDGLKINIRKMKTVDWKSEREISWGFRNSPNSRSSNTKHRPVKSAAASRPNKDLDLESTSDRVLHALHRFMQFCNSVNRKKLQNRKSFLWKLEGTCPLWEF